MGYGKELYTEEYYNKLYTDRVKDGPIRLDQKKIIDKMNMRDKSVLDIGCGCGEVLRYCLRRGASKVVGIDFSPVAIEMAKKNIGENPRCTLICGDVLDLLNQPKKPFDYIMMMDSIEHIPASEIDAILDNVHRLLMGKLIIQTPKYKLYEDYIKQGYYIRPSPSDRCPMTKGMHCTKYTTETLVALLDKHGFSTRNALVYVKKATPNANI